MPELWLSASTINGDMTKIDELDIEGIDGVEFGFLKSEGDLLIIEKSIKKKNIEVGFHHPIIKANKGDIFLSRQLTSHDSELRGKSFNQLKENLSTASYYGAKYYLVHAPTEIRDIDKVNISTEEYRSIVNKSLYYLEDLSREYNLPIIIESDGPNPFYNTAESLREMFNSHDALKHCLDTMHFAVFTGKYEYPCTVDELVDALSDITYSIHLSNTISPVGSGIDPRPTEGSRHFRLPVHPGQYSSDGWINILDIIKKVVSKNKDVLLVIEHIPYRSHDIEMLEYLGYNPSKYEQESINWLKSIVNIM